MWPQPSDACNWPTGWPQPSARSRAGDARHSRHSARPHLCYRVLLRGWQRSRPTEHRPGLQARLRAVARQRAGSVLAADMLAGGEPAGSAHRHPARLGAGRSLAVELCRAARKRHARNRRHGGCRSRPSAALALQRPSRRSAAICAALSGAAAPAGLPRILIRGDAILAGRKSWPGARTMLSTRSSACPATRFSSVSLTKPPTTPAPAGAARLCRDPIQGEILEDETSRLRPHGGNLDGPRHPLRRDQSGQRLKGSAAHCLHVIYCARGQAENQIKMHRSQLSDRTSCRSPIANQSVSSCTPPHTG